jgi:hypothetical protein
VRAIDVVGSDSVRARLDWTTLQTIVAEYLAAQGYTTQMHGRQKMPHVVLDGHDDESHSGALTHAK